MDEFGNEHQKYCSCVPKLIFFKKLTLNISKVYKVQGYNNFNIAKPIPKIL